MGAFFTAYNGKSTAQTPTPDRRRPGKSPIQIPGPQPAGKIPKPNRLVTAAAVVAVVAVVVVATRESRLCRQILILIFFSNFRDLQDLHIFAPLKTKKIRIFNFD